MTTEYAFRAATPADAERIVAVTVEGFETYRAFAPEGWTPPSAADEIARLLRLLGEDHVWYRVAEHEGELVGHVGFLPADRTFAPGRRPGACALPPALRHARALGQRPCHPAARRGDRRGRAPAASPPCACSRPAAQERARRFYEREGWALARPPAFERAHRPRRSPSTAARSERLLEQPAPHRLGHGGGAVTHAELLVERLEV